MTYVHVERQAAGKSPIWLLAAFIVSVLIAIAVVVRRTIALISPAAGDSAREAIDATFAAHKTLTLLHILPAAAFVLIAAMVLLSKQQSLLLNRFFYALGAWTGLTAFAMNAYAIGGWTERSAVLLFNTLFLTYLARAFWLSQSTRAREEHAWMLRAVGVLLGIATTRPVMGVFFATQSITHLRPEQFFGIAFWIGFSLNTIAVELWLRFGAPKGSRSGVPDALT